MRPLVAVMNARKMTEVYAALDNMPIDTVWMSGYWELELNQVMAKVVERAEREEYTHLALLSDDIVISNDSVQKVFDLAECGHPAVTAYCDMFRGSPDINITKRPFDNLTNPKTNYYLYTRDEAEGWPKTAIPTWFMGWSFSAMSIDMWKRFPFEALPDGTPKGWASDWYASTRLTIAGIPIVAPRGAFVQHLKGAASTPDSMKRPTRYDIAAWKRKTLPLPGSELLIGKMKKETRWEYKA